MGAQIFCANGAAGARDIYGGATTAADAPGWI
ncbi:hypothetical protein FHR96_001815 [Halomonas organivorans]|uniref:Uncharacterized protein n=1 Tax=Halomonas organivorans TaxID=257772 RepID=A0A7W5G608_9GAMM|nr:hypothetical protein [Halomonas organivorans]